MTGTVRHGLCIGGPRNNQTLATMTPGPVPHPDDPSGFYIFKSAVGPTPAQFLWITKKEKTNADQPAS